VVWIGLSYLTMSGSVTAALSGVALVLCVPRGAVVRSLPWVRVMALEHRVIPARADVLVQRFADRRSKRVVFLSHCILCYAGENVGSSRSRGKSQANLDRRYRSRCAGNGVDIE
jgi:hypothetical protein